MKIKYGLLVILILIKASLFAQDYIVGADLSFMKHVEDSGFKFKEYNKPRSGIRLFREHGYNWIRLRLFHTPIDLPNDLNYTIAAARAAKKNGMKFLLNFHYSDTWADPKDQQLPKAWEGLSHNELVIAIYEYTVQVMNALRYADVYPDMVQLGNEVSMGMMWPDGKLPQNWKNFADLLNAAASGVMQSCPDGACPRIMIHVDRGGNQNFTKYFYEKINSYHIPYDVIGLSYYPWWHGSITDFYHCLSSTATQFEKDIVLVETAYNWRQTEYKNDEGPFPETPSGQRSFLNEINCIIRSIPGNRGLGIFYWEPAVASGTRGFFDETGNALPVINVFDNRRKKE